LALETDLKIEREWRGTLQQNLDKEKAKVAKVQTDIQHLEEIKKVSQFFLFQANSAWLHAMTLPLSLLSVAFLKLTASSRSSAPLAAHPNTSHSATG